MPQKKTTNNNKPLRHQLIEFSGMAFEMLIIIGLFVYLGSLLDKKLQLGFPIGIILFCIIGFGIAIYFILKKL